MSYNTSESDFTTPQSLFEKLESKFGKFTLDVCASKENTKCKTFYTEKDNCLEKSWDGHVWCNPPYAVKVGKRIKGIVDVFIKKGLQEIRNNTKCEGICFLIPSKTDVKYFHDLIFSNKVEIVFIKGRPNFSGEHSCSKASGCRTPICAVYFSPHSTSLCCSGMDYK